MNLPSGGLALRCLNLKGKQVLALDTGRSPDSAEGLRLAKVSRGGGRLWYAGRLFWWTAQGVTQDSGHLLIWGEAEVPAFEGSGPAAWPLAEGADEFLRAFVAAWTSRVQAGDDLGPFTPSAMVPFHGDDGWGFLFLPDPVRSTLDSLQTSADRLAWGPLLRPDDTSLSGWMFASAALGLSSWGPLPWAQDAEEALRQEVRDLRRTLVPEELPADLTPAAQKLWFDSLVGQAATAGWLAWLDNSSWKTGTPDLDREDRARAQLRRLKRRRSTAFWRRRGALVTAVAAVSLVVLGVVGSVVWGAIKPDPTDVWTPEQVVRGYYAALETLDDQLLGKLTRGAQDPTVARDRDEVTNRFVIRQVRTAYELQSPILEAQAWEEKGRPALVPGQILYGLTSVSIEGSGTRWTVRYHRWASEGGDSTMPPKAVGEAVSDELTLVKTGRGWKVSAVHRQSQPLS